MARTPAKLAADGNALMVTIEGLGIDVTRDKFKVTGAAGVIVAHVAKASGQVVSARIRGRSFKQMTQFDPNEISVSERRQLEKQMYDDGLTQSEIADLLGVSQSLVAKDLSLLRQGK